MIHAEFTLSHEFFQVPITDGKPKIMADTQDDDFGFEMSSREQRWPFL